LVAPSKENGGHVSEPIVGKIVGLGVGVVVRVDVGVVVGVDVGVVVGLVSQT
jgi:hypothetical protein